MGIALLAVALPGAAADDRRADREARRAQLLQQRLTEEAAKWETERAALQKQIADREQTLTALKSAQQESGKNAARLSNESAELKKKTADLEKMLSEQQRTASGNLNGKEREIEAFGQARKQERLQLNERYEAKVAALAACEEKNARLIKVGSELLNRYRDKGVVEALRQREPFLQLEDVEMFNLVQDYREKIDSGRTAPAVPNP